ncbi:MAG: DUF2157 domain-containing protein [Gammaproteobacteria bacterium]|nr:DUF2157 domain-containing protein [Gammaproteobacteria bacterium]
MNLDYQDLQDAIDAKLLTSAQAKKLWSFWEKESKKPQFQLSHVMYYFGGMLAISAVTLFVTNAWEQLRGLPLLIISLLLFTLGLSLSKLFLKKDFAIPAGIMCTFSLAVVPLAVYNLQVMMGLLPPPAHNYSDFHQWINWYWVPMELITLVVGLVMLYFYRFPFLLFPISVTLWYLSMDVFTLLFHLNDYTWRSTFSVYYGLAVIFAAMYMDFKHSNSKKDYAFWLYLFGACIFWGGLSCLNWHSELSKLMYALINFGMIIASVFVNRRVFAVLGTLGILSYLGHLSFTLFANSLGFPISLVFLGIIIIFTATRWSRMENKLLKYFQNYIPQKKTK